MRPSRLLEDITINSFRRRGEDPPSSTRSGNLNESPVQTTIRITRDPASPEEEKGDYRAFPVMKESFSPSKTRHDRLPSDTSSIVVPRIDQSMSMLLQEKEDGYDGTSLYSGGDGSLPPSPTMHIDKPSPRSSHHSHLTPNRQPTSDSLSPNITGLHTPVRKRTNPASTNMDLSPTTTTADYSYVPGSPGSLVLRPEDERHLDELLSFVGAEETL